MQIMQVKMDPSYFYYGTVDVGHWADTSFLVVLIAYVFAAISWKIYESPILRWSRSNIAKREARQLSSL